METSPSTVNSASPQTEQLHKAETMRGPSASLTNFPSSRNGRFNKAITIASWNSTRGRKKKKGRRRNNLTSFSYSIQLKGKQNPQLPERMQLVSQNELTERTMKGWSPPAPCSSLSRLPLSVLPHKAILPLPNPCTGKCSAHQMTSAQAALPGGGAEPAALCCTRTPPRAPKPHSS